MLKNEHIEKVSKKQEAALRAVLEHHSTDAFAWFKLDNLLAQKKRRGEAETAIRIALKHQSTHMTAWVNLGLLLTQQQRVKEARDALNTALLIAPVD